MLDEVVWQTIERTIEEAEQEVDRCIHALADTQWQYRQKVIQHEAMSEANVFVAESDRAMLKHMRGEVQERREQLQTAERTVSRLERVLQRARNDEGYYQRLARDLDV